jgi:hypothetical protein
MYKVWMELKIKMLNTKNSIIPNLYYIKIKHDANKYLELKIPRTWLIFQAMVENRPTYLKNERGRLSTIDLLVLTSLDLLLLIQQT